MASDSEKTEAQFLRCVAWGNFNGNFNTKR
jgi:hypothetical protein